MTIKICPLDSIKHKNTRIKVDPAYGHVSGQQMIPVLAFEFLKASSSFPIVFVKQQDTGKFKSVALTGFEEAENLVFSQGKINADYIPVNLRRYPFAAGGKDINDKNMILCIDESSSLVNENEGVELFDDEGKPTETTEKISEFLVDIVARDHATDNFINCMIENDLLQPTELKLKLGDGNERNINGIYKIDEEALNELSDEVALTLYKKQYFSVIYAHLASLAQFNRLIKLKEAQDAEKLTD
jgi:hypothetical protein